MDQIKNAVICENCTHCEEQSVEESCYHSSDGLRTVWEGLGCNLHDVKPLSECCADGCERYEEDPTCEYKQVAHKVYCFSDLYNALDKRMRERLYHIAFSVANYFYQKGYIAARKEMDKVNSNKEE